MSIIECVRVVVPAVGAARAASVFVLVFSHINKQIFMVIRSACCAALISIYNLRWCLRESQFKESERTQMYRI